MIASARSFLRRQRESLLAQGTLRGRFAAGAFWSIAAAVVSRGFNLAAAIACARLMGQGGLGEYGMVQSTVSALGAFSVLGLGLTATRYVSEFRDKDPAKVARILRISSTASAVSGAVVGGLLALCAPALARTVLASPQIATPLALGGAIVLLNSLIAFQNGALAGFEAFQAIARTNLFSGLATFVFIAIGAWKGGVTGAIIGTVASLLVNLVLNGVVLRAQYRAARIDLRGSDWKREAHVFWSFSLPAFLSSLVVGPALWACNAILVHHPGGYAQLGLYTAADRWRAALLFLPTSLFRMVFPLLSNLKGNDDMVRYRRLNRATMILNLLLVAVPALGLAALSRTIMGTYGAGFEGGWPILAILVLGTIPEALNVIVGYPLVIGHRMWVRSGFDLLLAVLLVVTSAVLIPRWGAVGFAVSYVSAFAVTSVGLSVFTWLAHVEERLAPAPGGTAAVPPNSEP